MSGWTTTLADSADISGEETDPSGATWDGHHAMYCGYADDFIYHCSGFSATLQDSADVSGIDTDPHGITFDGIHAKWCGQEAGKIYQSSGFSATIANSADISGVDNAPTGTTWDGNHSIFCGTEASKLYLCSGFSATISNSVDVSGDDGTPTGSGWSPCYERLGWFNVGLIKMRFSNGGRARHAVRSHRIMPHMIDFGRRYNRLRGRFRIEGAPVYLIYRSNSGIVTEDDTAWVTVSSLPDTPTDTFANGTWYLGMQYRNKYGILSGFRPVGPNGELYKRLDISAGDEIGSPPNEPNEWHLYVDVGGVVRIRGLYWQNDSMRAEEWAITVTYNGSTPGDGSPDHTVTIPTSGPVILDYALGAQADGTTVKVRLQTRRDLGGSVYTYSENTAAGDVETATADAVGPSAPPYADTHHGAIPEG